jgi:hypothetical protein
VKREFACAASRPQSGCQSFPVHNRIRLSASKHNCCFCIFTIIERVPCQSIKCLGGALSPSHHTSLSSVRATFVNRVFLRIAAKALALVLGDVPGATPKKPLSGLTAYKRPSLPMRIHAISSPTVSICRPLVRSTTSSKTRSGSGSCTAAATATATYLPTGNGRLQHGEIGLTTSARERGCNVLLLAIRRCDAEDQHVLCKPALITCQHRCDSQRQALFAKQRIAAVARTIRHNAPLLGIVHNVLGGVARPCNICATRLQWRTDRVRARHKFVITARRPCWSEACILIPIERATHT